MKGNESVGEEANEVAEIAGTQRCPARFFHSAMSSI